MPNRVRALLRGKANLGLGSNTTRSQDAQRALARALDRQRKRLPGREADTVDCQLLGQVTPAVEWVKLLAYWERRNPSGVAAWPRRLEPGAYALNLWPLPADRVGRGSGLGGDVRKRQPKKLLCTPGLTVFHPEQTGGDAETALAVVCATWLDDVGMTDFQALRLSPPILEIWAAAGRCVSREVVSFGMEWTLPTADDA